MKKKRPVKRKKAIEPPSTPILPQPPIEDDFLLSSPRTILDEGLSDAARLLVDVAQGRVDASREQLAAAQDILNRSGIGAGGGKQNTFPEAFARDAFATVFRLLGFAPIKWPSSGLKSAASAVAEETSERDAFNDALQGA